jgi:hypothetical protein
LVVHFWYEGSGWFVSCNLIGSITSDVIGTHILARHFFNVEDESAGIFYTEDGGVD